MNKLINLKPADISDFFTVLPSPVDGIRYRNGMYVCSMYGTTQKYDSMNSQIIITSNNNSKPL